MLLRLLVLLGIALASTNAAYIGQCGAPLNTPCGHVDFQVPFSVSESDFGDSDEVTIVVDLDFDAWGINYVTAIEQMYDASCHGYCVALTNLPEHPAFCTRGIADVSLWTYDTLPTFDEEPRFDGGDDDSVGDLAVELFPGDKFVNFNFGEEGSFVRFGGETAKAYGRVAIRVLWYNGFEDGDYYVTVRFHTACPEDVPEVSTFAGYLSSSAYPTALVYPFDIPQSRTGRISVPFVQKLLARENVDSIWIHAAGVFGRDWMTSATLYKIDSRGIKSEILSVGDSGVEENIWNEPHLSEVMVELKAGDFLQWTCVYESTETPALPWRGEDDGGIESIESGDEYSNFACDFSGVFTNSRCGAAYFDSENTSPRDCLDPLFDGTDDVEEEEQVHLVYDYNYRDGACSDGGQWEGHPYHCTDQYGGGKCAFCVGRANNMESRTCIDRQGMECPVMFGTDERKSKCNMEFECDARSLSFSVVMVVILALVALLV